MFRQLFYLLTGGRPMVRERYMGFEDPFTLQPVYAYRDRYDRLWMSTSRWSLFRVSISPEDK